jgi:GT2 family glycosyltransferase
MISVIITSFTDFGDLTTPLINSMRKHEKKPIELIIVDNGSKKPYPAGKGYSIIRFNKPANWARMLNAGVDASNGDWVCILNDDVLCKGPYVDLIEGLDKTAVHGPAINHKPPEWHNVGVQINYIPAWIFVMQKSIYNQLDGMDEWYPKVGMEDIDFCWRAEQAGIRLNQVTFPFVHLDKHRRNKWDGFREQMQKSIDYFIENKVKA